MEGYHLPEAGRPVLFRSQVNGLHAGGKLMVVVLKHLAKLSHAEHLTTEGTTLEMARVCDWNIRHASANPSKAILPPLPVHFLTNHCLRESTQAASRSGKATVPARENCMAVNWQVSGRPWRRLRFFQVLSDGGAGRHRRRRASSRRA
jgi:hypothetical protein